MFFPDFFILTSVSHRRFAIPKSRSVFDKNLMSLVVGRWSLENLRATTDHRLTTILPNHFNAHRPRRTAHAPDGGIDRSGVQIRHLLFRDVFDLLQRHLANLISVGRARSL